MKSLLLFITTLTVFFNSHTACAQAAPPIQWQKSLGGTASDASYSIQQTSDGGFIAAGLSSSEDGDVTGNHGGYDYWIVRLTPDGGLTWQKSLGGSFEEYALSTQQTTDGGFVVAGYAQSVDGDVTGNHGFSDYWIVKLDASGNITWQKSYGGGLDDIGQAIQQTTDGGYITAGWSNSVDGDVTGNHGFADFWIVKSDVSGNITWQKSLGGSDDDRASYIQQTTDGGYIISGWSYSTDGDVTGNHGGYDLWIVKIDASGNITWQKSLGGSSDEIASGVQQTADGGYIVSGYSYSSDGDLTINHGSADYWVLKLDGSGNLIWQKTLGGSEYDAAYSVVQTADEDYIVSGVTSSTDGDVVGNHGDFDAWILRLDASGNIVWQTCMGGSDEDAAYFSIPTADGGYISAGESESNDGDVSGNHGFFDSWIVKLSCPQTAFYSDADNDGYGNADSVVMACSPSLGYVADSTDCDDSNNAINPGEAEVCNTIDDNCNGDTDEGVLLTFYLDSDNDNYGNLNFTSTGCSAPTGYVANGTDCDDSNDAINPGEAELCNGIDDNCISGADDGLIFITYYLDSDNDNYGNDQVSSTTCSGAPLNYVTDSTDCNDSDPDINPGEPENTNNGIDDDCDGETDEFGVGIDESESIASFIMFPNPVSDLLTIQFYSRIVDDTIEVFDMSGRKMILTSKHFTTRIELNTHSLPVGIYNLQIFNTLTGQREIRKFVKS